MTPGPYRLVVFDFDGTLADSFPWFARVINDVADRYRFARIAPDETEVLRGLDAAGIVRHLGIAPWKLPFISRHMHALAARDIGEIQLFPGIAAMLSDLDAAGMPLAIVSSNTRANIEAVLGPEARRFRYFAYGASLFGKGRRLGALIREAGFDPAMVLYVGDEIRDHDAARAAGCSFAAVAWGYTRLEALRATGPALLLHSPGAVAAAVTAPLSVRAR
ncbi:Phosphoglycolate phosphatase [Methylobacterium adhaesivum]|uniref:HAD hydrolase-like protein n=1 Tax=Methylobacterium adhaesivum TaxID=333297 RepID=A0ABT8BLR9_9HYPH|nr:HAD hydrolase-like protein [Methylobacterium adhaesivum]MDN3592148.1 HAD hydrolase-like protein [Methylobacterium adhaesivum]GJD31535.1 Phosphoglycolate phosphatase [Methylobacterium adhaesivum]